MCLDMHIYIYIEREREMSYIYIYIYIYMFAHMPLGRLCFSYGFHYIRHIFELVSVLVSVSVFV